MSIVDVKERYSKEMQLTNSSMYAFNIILNSTTVITNIIGTTGGVDAFQSDLSFSCDKNNIFMCYKYDTNEVVLINTVVQFQRPSVSVSCTIRMP